MKKQMIYDKVRKHLLRQGVRSYNEYEDTCLYRGPNRTRCAIGCLVPFRVSMNRAEGLRVGALRGCSDIVDALKKYEIYWDNMGDIAFLMELQDIHDCTKPTAWKKELKAFAKTHNLKESQHEMQTPA